MDVKGTILEDWLKNFCMVDKVSVPDGAGGFYPTYHDSAPFEAVQMHDSTIEAQIAEREGTASTYKLYVDKDLEFEFHDIIKCVDNGCIFRITVTDGPVTPNVSDLNMKSIMCERFDLKY